MGIDGTTYLYTLVNRNRLSVYDLLPSIMVLGAALFVSIMVIKMHLASVDYLLPDNAFFDCYFEVGIKLLFFMKEY